MTNILKFPPRKKPNIRRRPKWYGYLVQWTTIAVLFGAWFAIDRIQPDWAESTDEWLPKQLVKGNGFRAIDGDSLYKDKVDYRLYGIDAPELNQECLTSKGAKYACGREAKSALAKIIRGQTVLCSKKTTDRYGRQVVQCKADQVDVNREMVKQGWAIAYSLHSTLFLSDQREARAAKRGIWQGKFEPPEAYRNRNRTAKSSAEILTASDGD